ncbi:amino acid ABC transporter substrate-binding protein [Vagococcus fluvialis]|uniref:amino acid ABC transporter substrate-binding protein n=1 Tax=Vagococcus fluvialis TaxID=2738 RepID=UPI0020342C82|nr:transporter substrate-binding domain-containing protein [Vagococcus fluvialis]MCM2137857.1 transporter substrate-binding domain-containing protein [Vagococcus fluvialis]
MKRLLKIGGTVLGLSLILAGCGNADEKTKTSKWDDIKEKNELVIGIDDTFVPMGFRDEKDNIVGFDIDLAKEVTKELGIKAKFQPIDWTLKETELDNGTIDVIWNGYTVTDARKEKVDFTMNYLSNEQVLVSLSDSGIKTFKDMKDKVIGAQEGSSGADSFEDNPELLKDFVKDQEAILYPTFTEAFLDLEAKRIDGLLIDKVFAEYYISQQKDSKKFAIAPSEFENENFAIGVKKGETELVKQLNDALQKAYKDGSSIKVSEKWFGENRVLTE